jgi:hypothetical protein
MQYAAAVICYNTSNKQNRCIGKQRNGLYFQLLRYTPRE